MKVDLAIWTLNGGKTLPAVLGRINQAVPPNVVNQKMIIDDGSKDNTVQVAKQYGWQVLKNEGKGISDGANTALRHVQTSYFCSFEQDVFLPKDWWSKLSPLILNKKNVAAASGHYFVAKNNFCYSLEQYSFSRRKVDFHGGLGKVLGDTIWNTEILRSLGGFPKLRVCGIDTVLWNLVDLEGYKWLVADDVRCLHLHQGGIRGEFKRFYFYGVGMPQTVNKLSSMYKAYRKPDVYNKENRTTFFLRFAKSPVASLKITAKTRDPRVTLIYPITTFGYFLGYIRGMTWAKS